jgi:hypothetical protein
MEGQGHCLLVGQFDWLFIRANKVATHPGSLVLANEVADHLLLQPNASPALTEVCCTWQPSLRQRSDLTAVGWGIQRIAPL